MNLAELVTFSTVSTLDTFFEFGYLLCMEVHVRTVLHWHCHLRKKFGTDNANEIEKVRYVRVLPYTKGIQIQKKYPT